MSAARTHLPSDLFLLRQRRVAAENVHRTGMGTTIKYVRRTVSFCRVFFSWRGSIASPQATVSAPA
jgi:hypothetical protein